MNIRTFVQSIQHQLYLFTVGEKNFKFGTKAIHAGVDADPTTGAVMTPIYQTSTFVQDKVGQHRGYEYSRTQNPTRHALEKAIAELENANFGIAFASGVAAIDAVIKLLAPGDEVIATKELYGGSYRLFKGVYEKFGISFRFVDMNDLTAIQAVVNENTKLFWVETPTNPTVSIIDVKAIVDIAKKGNAWVAVDNTFATPYFQNPINLGADIVMHSVTKYLGGHSDVVMGALATSSKELADQLYAIQNSTGAIPGPMDAFLVLRGLKTLHLRMERHQQNAEKIAYFLQNHPRVDQVYWPGFEDHPGNSIAKEQMSGFGGMVSFSLKGNKLTEAHEIMEKLQVFTLAESLGGVESLTCHPATMTHASIPKNERESISIVDSLIRLSVGVEDADDLVKDLAHALDK